jgi:heme-degrading monooxygenase HmoA
MHMLVVVQRQAQPGQVEALIEAARARWGARGRWQPGRRAVRLLQSVTVPERTLYLAEWDSAATYRADRASRPTSTLDALCVAPALPQLFQPLWLYQHMGKRPVYVNAVLYHLPPAARAATLQFLTGDSRGQVRALPGLLLHALYEDQDDPTQLLTLDGWASPADFVRFQHQLVPLFAVQRAVLGFTVERFVGRLRLDIDRWGADERRRQG